MYTALASAHRFNSILSNSIVTLAWSEHKYIDVFVQDCSNSIANALELPQSCTKPSEHFREPDITWPGSPEYSDLSPRLVNPTLSWSYGHCHSSCFKIKFPYFCHSPGFPLTFHLLSQHTVVTIYQCDGIALPCVFTMQLHEESLNRQQIASHVFFGEFLSNYARSRRQKEALRRSPLSNCWSLGMDK